MESYCVFRCKLCYSIWNLPPSNSCTRVFIATIKFLKKLVVSCDEESFRIFIPIYSMRVYPSTLMFTGKINPMTFIIDSSYARLLPPFYIDKFGFREYYYNRNIPLFLNENNYEMFTKKILSEDFSYDLCTARDSLRRMNIHDYMI